MSPWLCDGAVTSVMLFGSTMVTDESVSSSGTLNATCDDTGLCWLHSIVDAGVSVGVADSVPASLDKDRATGLHSAVWPNTVLHKSYKASTSFPYHCDFNCGHGPLYTAS